MAPESARAAAAVASQPTSVRTSCQVTAKRRTTVLPQASRSPARSVSPTVAPAPAGLTRSPLDRVGHRARVAAPPRRRSRRRPTGGPAPSISPGDREAPRVEGRVVVPHEALGAGRCGAPAVGARRSRSEFGSGAAVPVGLLSSGFLASCGRAVLAPPAGRERPCCARRARGWSRRKAVPRGSPSLRRAAVAAEPCSPTAIACPIASATAVAASPPVSRRSAAG